MLEAYLRWTATASNYWSSYGSTDPGNGDGKYRVSIGEALYVGREEDPGDFWSLEEAMADVAPDKRVVNSRQTFDTFVDKMEAQAPESVYTGNCAAQNCMLADPMVSVLINASSAQVSAFIPHSHRGDSHRTQRTQKLSWTIGCRGVIGKVLVPPVWSAISSCILSPPQVGWLGGQLFGWLCDHGTVCYNVSQKVHQSICYLISAVYYNLLFSF